MKVKHFQTICTHTLVAPSLRSVGELSILDAIWQLLLNHFLSCTLKHKEQQQQQDTGTRITRFEAISPLVGEGGSDWKLPEIAPPLPRPPTIQPKPSSHYVLHLFDCRSIFLPHLIFHGSPTSFLLFLKYSYIIIHSYSELLLCKIFICTLSLEDGWIFSCALI